MQKAQVRANEYFWTRLAGILDQPTPHELVRFSEYNRENWKLDGASYLYLLLSDRGPAFCHYTANADSYIVMSQEVFDAGMQYARSHNMIPVYIGNPTELWSKADRHCVHVRIDEYRFLKQLEINEVELRIPIFHPTSDRTQLGGLDGASTCILAIDKTTISELLLTISALSKYYSRINVMKTDVRGWDNIIMSAYKEELKRIEKWRHQSSVKVDINILPIRGTAGESRCAAGISEYTLAPDGNFYICPAYYFDGLFSCGSIADGIINPYKEILSMDKRKKCAMCSNDNCMACTYLDFSRHHMLGATSLQQCSIATAEKEAQILQM